MRHAHRFRRDGSNFLGIHRHGSPPSSASPDALALVLLSVLPILSCFSRLYFCFHSPAESSSARFLVMRQSRQAISSSSETPSDFFCLHIAHSLQHMTFLL